jgi:hypothetical protein
VAKKLPFAHDAFLELRRNAGAIGDPSLRAAVEAQILTPWLPKEAWAYSHLEEARKELPGLELPPPNKGDFAAAPGGPCNDGHHGYPGGLGVHSLANLLHARALGQVYEHIYGIKLRDDWLVTAAVWHDSLKSATLPFDKDGNCGPEPKIAGTAAHHVLGIAAAMLRHLPAEVVLVIAASHLPPAPDNMKTICSWIEAAGLIARGEKPKCDLKARPPPEAFVNHFADADYPFTVTTWTEYANKTPKGWARYEALMNEGNDVALFSR